MRKSVTQVKIENIIKEDVNYRKIESCGTCHYFGINKVTSSQRQMPNHCKMFSLMQEDDIHFVFLVSPNAYTCDYHIPIKVSPGLKFPLKSRGV